MKIKLTRSQFDALYPLVETNLKEFIEGKKRGMIAVIITDVLQSVFVKFYKQNAFSKDKYSINLTPSEACALYLYFEKLEVGFDHYVSTIIRTILTDIHKKYS